MPNGRLRTLSLFPRKSLAASQEAKERGEDPPPPETRGKGIGNKFMERLRSNEDEDEELPKPESAPRHDLAPPAANRPVRSRCACFLLTCSVP